MSVRGIGDAFAFQRLLWLLVGTVIVPTVLLSLYGVMAIRNQQAAIEEQVRREQAERLQFAARTIFEGVERADAEVRASLPGCSGSTCPPPEQGVQTVWRWTDVMPAELEALNPPSPTTPRTTWFRPADGGDAIGVLDLGDIHAAWRLDPDGLVALVRERASQRYDDGVHFDLRARAAGPATPVEELIQRWERDGFEATLPLERPLTEFEVVVTYPDNDPARAILGSSSWLYPAGLVFLVATVMAGTVVTLNSAAREIRLSRLQTDFVSSVSHELRTPLTSIRMFVETLQSGRIQDPERIQECLDLLSQETDRLSRMIERVLSWARMEAGRRVYDVETVRPEELVEDALAAFRSQWLMEAPQDVEVTLPPDLPRLRVDRDAIVEALVNLLQNAVKHTPAPRRIALEVERKGNQVGLSVTDDGPGIALADRNRVFEKFYQADTRLSSPTGAHRGSGLGLAIVRAVVRGHGGRVDLQTEEGAGCRFTIWLPVAV
ncbi:MAG: HAMP domain-containing histidine kinase [Alphaproteobacteria bacterium]|nr:HAMP domain-containing histidine kinase [Alphaproteobacteria bacterium]MCB9690558.1 HAMP domain-containing histidine kinase [Alphaproteobacteria bacterium]